MNTPTPRLPSSSPSAVPAVPAASPSQRAAVDDLQVRNWLRLRRELFELNARLEYLKLMVKLRVPG